MAIDPARIRRRMEEAEESGRRGLGVEEARAALCVLAVVVDGGPQEEPCRCRVARLVQAS